MDKSEASSTYYVNPYNLKRSPPRPTNIELRSRIQPLSKAFICTSSVQSYLKQSHLEHGGVLEVGLGFEGLPAPDLFCGVLPVVGLLVLPGAQFN